MSLRKEKAARIKVQVLDYTIKLIGKKSFDDLYIEDLCGKVKVSKVTLFHYFPKKEDILLYFYRVWCLSRCVDLTVKPKEGLAGIYFLFDKLSEACEHYPGLMTGVMGYLANLKRSPKPFPIKVEEKKLLFPAVAGISAIEILSLEQLLEKFVLEAILNKEITRTSSTRDITNLFTTVFMGGVIGAQVYQVPAVKLYFRKNIDLILKGLN